MTEAKYVLSFKSPAGFLTLRSTALALTELSFSDSEEKSSDEIPRILYQTKQQLEEYFEGKRFHFDLNLAPDGTGFQQKVWTLLKEIPFGETTTYLELARKLGSATYTRAVGLANGKNPIPIIIPCHRVIGAKGQMVGFAGGIEKKKMLLLHELNYKKTGKLF